MDFLDEPVECYFTWSISGIRNLNLRGRLALNFRIKMIAPLLTFLFSMFPIEAAPVLIAMNFFCFSDLLKRGSTAWNKETTPIVLTRKCFCISSKSASATLGCEFEIAALATTTSMEVMLWVFWRSCTAAEALSLTELSIFTTMRELDGPAGSFDRAREEG